jgi:Predicted periplasmic or secreted lipoprotein
MVGDATVKSDKKDLESRVIAALSSYYMHELFVSTDEEGTVSIRGEVDALYDKLNIYQIVSRIPGVKKIIDNVYVNTPIVPDDMIKTNIRRTIQDNSVILEPDKITVNVNDGMIFLRGTVSNYTEKIMATTISSWQDGVKGVENEINVLPSQEAKSDENIKSILNEIIQNHFPFIDNFSITVINGNVTLEGNAQTLWEKNHLKEEFLQVLGVKSVVENLEVKPR